MLKLFRIGEKYITNEGYVMEIIEYRGDSDCDVLLEDGNILVNINIQPLKKGQIKNPFHRSVCGIGFLGVGVHKASIKNKHTLSSYSWRHMLQRCYDEKRQDKNPTYKGVKVCEEWHNFQNFAAWYEKNYKPEIMQGWHLDKDIICKDCRIYSPENCCFVPREINSLFTKKNSKQTGLPIGVFKNRSGGFKSVMTIGGKSVHLGTTYNIEESFKLYKKQREKRIKEVAEKWKDLIDSRVYEAMINYEVNING